MLRWLLIFIPISAALAWTHANPLWVFVTGIIAIIPLADTIRKSTEELSKHTGSAAGGLLNVTFGNLPELILALFVLRDGNIGVVKAQITGSLIGNSLFGLGLAALVGGWRRVKQTFVCEQVGLQSSLLTLSIIAIALPAAFTYTEHGQISATEMSHLSEMLSIGVAVVLLLVYGASLVYTLVTHRDIFSQLDQTPETDWPLSKALGILILATLATAFEAELVAGALSETAKSVGLSEFFLGIIVLAVVGNASEYFAAVYFAKKDRMDMVLQITVGSTIQIALFTAPVLVLVSYFMGKPMNLVFNNPLELIAIVGAALAIKTIAQDGETNWFEGVLLLAIYALMAFAFFFVKL